MNRQSFKYMVFFLGVLFVLSDSMSAMRREILRSEAAADVQEFLGTALDHAGAVSCWFSKLSQQEDPI